MSLTRSLIPQQHRPILDQLLVRLSLRQGHPCRARLDDPEAFRVRDLRAAVESHNIAVTSPRWGGDRMSSPLWRDAIWAIQFPWFRNSTGSAGWSSVNLAIRGPLKIAARHGRLRATLGLHPGTTPANRAVQETLILRGFLEAVLLWRRGRDSHPR